MGFNRQKLEDQRPEAAEKEAASRHYCCLTAHGSAITTINMTRRR
jgi:hypothetical protein